jgi:peroxiredoxin
MKEIILKRAIYASIMLIFFAAGCSQKIEQSFVSSPEKPLAGQEITVVYNPKATPLKDSDQIEMLAYEFTLAPTPHVQEVEVSKIGDSFQGTFKADTTTLLVLMKFKSDKKEDVNDPDGHVISFYDSSRISIPGVYAALAGVRLNGAYPIRLKRDAQKALEMIRKEFELFPNQKDNYNELYWNILLRADKENGKATVLASVDSLAAKEKLTLDEKKLAMNFYLRLQHPEKAEPFKEQIRQAEPKGELVQSERFQEFYQEKNLYNMVNLYNRFKVDLPDNRNLSYMTMKVLNKYIELKRFDEAQNFLETLAVNVEANHYNSLSWALVEEGINFQTASEIAAKGVEHARQSLGGLMVKKPVFQTNEEWLQQQKFSLGAILDTYAASLYKMDRLQDAIPAFEESVDLTEKTNADINERYANALLDAKQNEKALKFVEALIRDGNTTEALDEQFKKAYIALNQSEEGLDTALVSALEAGKEKVKANLAEELLNKPAPDFNLADLGGKNISLKSMRGKTVILDFWATWYGPCVASFPGMQKAVQKFENDGSVEFLFINTWERGGNVKQQVADFIEKNNYTFHVLLDSENKVVEAFGVDGIPTKFIVDKNGKIQFKSVGFGGDTEKLVEELSLMIEMVR